MDIKFSLVKNWQEQIGKFIKEYSYSAIFVLTDSGSKRHCLPLVKPFLPASTQFISIPSGEKNKTLESCGKVWNLLSSKNADRKSVVFNLGGGMVGDLGGFCAATYKRGIDFIQIPTTLLSMVDASLGGKTGIDFQGYKNQLGAFRQPADVWVFPDFLKTLPEKELLSGFAEVIKHSLIADSNSWNILRKRDMAYQPWPQIIPSSLEVKKSIVLTDLFEKNERKKLNAGHTIGHAIESLLLGRQYPIPHGHCVAAGLVMESFISLENGFISEPELIHIEELVYTLYGSLPIKKSDKKALWNLAQQDKKNENSEVRMSLVGPIGNCRYDVSVNQSSFNKAIDYYLGDL